MYFINKPQGLRLLQEFAQYKSTVILYNKASNII